MYSPLAPILAADSPSQADLAQMHVRIEGLAVVLATVSRLAGTAQGALFDAFASRAQLAAALASAAPDKAGQAARALDTLGVQLQAGLLSLEKARKSARLNRAAAAMLYRESFESLGSILAALGYRTAQ